MFLFSSLLPFHFPCALCQAPCPGGDLCPECKASLPWIDSACHCCGLPLPAGAEQLQCGECLARPSFFQTAIIPFYYSTPISGLITGFKHRRQLTSGRVLGGLLAETIRDHYLDRPLPEAILPVPLHWRRHWWRGYNQSVELGQMLSRELGIPCHSSLLKRIRPTPSQQRLGRYQRLRNLQEAFAITQAIPFRRVVLLDDVVTTGATTQALAHVLREQGIENIHLWAVARTPH